MKLSRKRVAIVSAVVAFILAAACLTDTGQSAIRSLFNNQASSISVAPEVEQRAQAKHGWDNKSIKNSVVQGTLIQYSLDGLDTQQLGIKLYRSYPNRLRLEISEGGKTWVAGFDGKEAWREGIDKLQDVDARDIRSWMRMWPERLFMERGKEATFREVGQFIDERAGRRPDRESTNQGQETVADRLEVEDTIELDPQDSHEAGDRRRITYYLDSEKSLVYAARWLEPVDPTKSIEDVNAALIDVRVDFGRWTQIGNGTIWPFEVTCWRGGRIDFRVDVNDVKFNEPVGDTLFENPNK